MPNSWRLSRKTRQTVAEGARTSNEAAGQLRGSGAGFFKAPFDMPGSTHAGRHTLGVKPRRWGTSSRAGRGGRSERSQVAGRCFAQRQDCRGQHDVSDDRHDDALELIRPTPRWRSYRDARGPRNDVRSRASRAGGRFETGTAPQTLYVCFLRWCHLAGREAPKGVRARAELQPVAHGSGTRPYTTGPHQRGRLERGTGPGIAGGGHR
jgi:hypothetical protein